MNTQFFEQENALPEEVVFEEEITLVEEENTESEEGAFARIAKGLLFLLVGLLPIWFLPFTTFPTETGKLLLVTVLGLLVFIAWIASGLQDGGIRIIRSVVLWAFGLFLVGWAIAGVFSVSVYQSFFGAGHEGATFVTLFAGGLLALLIASITSERADLMKGLFITLISGGLVILFFLLRSVLDIPLFGTRAFNLIGTWSELGIFFGALAALTFPLLRLPKNLLVRYVAIGILAVSLIGLFIVNYIWAWVGIGVLALIFFALYFSAGERKSLVFSLAFFLVILATLLVLVNPQVDGLAAYFGQPLQVSPSSQGTLAIAKDVISENPIFGFGPNTFGLSWEAFRPDGISSTPFWRTQFPSGSSLLLTVFIEGGLLAGILLLLFVGTFLVMGVRAIVGAFYADEVYWEKDVVLGFFSSTLFLLFMWFVSPINASLILLTFVMLGFFMASAHRVGVGKVRRISFFRNPQEGFIASLATIILVIVSVYGLYLSTTRYVAEATYQSGVELFQESGEVDAAIEKIIGATELYGQNAKYTQALAELQIVKMRQALNATGITPEEAREDFQGALQEGIRYGQEATTIEPALAANWEVLARVYATALPIVPGAIEFVVKNYDEAILRSPRDPALYDGLAVAHTTNTGVLIRNKATESEVSAERMHAIERLEAALRIKADYAPAHFKLANLYSAEGRRDEAVDRAGAAFVLAPNDVGAALQLGVLYYQNQNFTAARAPFERAVRINANYSNARYFLGLIEDREGNSEAALAQFETIAALNPDNVEVQKIIENLKGGLRALTNIQDIPEPPITESAERSVPTE